MLMTRRQVVGVALSFPFVTAFGAFAQEDMRFYVVGFVKNPGSFALKGAMTIGDGVNAAGGVINGGTLGGLQVVRVIDGEKKTVDVSVSDAILANDTIRVRR